MVAVWVADRRSSHGNEFRHCLKNWLIHEQRRTQGIVDACMLLLDEDFLLTLPLPPGVILLKSPGPRNFRFLFRRHVASLLGWTERRGEGEPHGFSDSVYKFIREVWWPDEGAEALHRAGLQNRQSGCSYPLRWSFRSQTAHLRRRCSSSRMVLQAFKTRSSPSLSSHLRGSGSITRMPRVRRRVNIIPNRKSHSILSASLLPKRQVLINIFDIELSLKAESVE